MKEERKNCDTIQMDPFSIGKYYAFFNQPILMRFGQIVGSIGQGNPK